MLSVRAFKTSDIPEIKSWMAKRAVPGEFMPATYGYIIPDFCFAQFLLFENGGAMFDSLITNPEKSAQERNEALDELVGYMIKDIKISNGAEYIFAFSSDTTVVERAKKHGLVELPYKTLMLRN